MIKFESFNFEIMVGKLYTLSVANFAVYNLVKITVKYVINN